jgi:branched-chain amino acid transport system substrate-binding protein
MTSRPVRWLTPVLVGLATVSTLSACSSSGGGSGDASSVIKIGNVGSYTSPQSPSYVGSTAALKAWANGVNAKGGVNGHKIDLIIKDDQGNAATAVTAVKELIQQDHVVALVGEDSYVDDAWGPIAKAAGVPVIGGGPYDSVMETNPDFFPSGTTALPAAYALVQLMKSVGNNVGMLYCAEAPICQQSVGLFKAFGSGVGLKLAVAQSVSASAPNYTAQCQALIDAKVDVVAVNTSGQIARRIVSACATQGLKARLVEPGGIITSDWLKDPAAQSALTLSFNAPYFDAKAPGVQSMMAMLKANHLSQTPTGGVIFAYTGAQLFLKAVAGVKGAITSSSLITALYAMKNETLGGLTPPLTYTKGAPTSVLCYFGITVKNQTFAQSAPATNCANASAVAAAKQKLTS